MIGAATQAHAAPSYGYGDADYGYAPAPVVVRPAPVYRVYEEEAPVYATRRTVTYERVPVGSGPARHGRGEYEGACGYRGACSRRVGRPRSGARARALSTWTR
ncbi:hypothetical protein [Methylobacterium radiotolerans]|uniref:hypothetical protein n=1 Tax=Methylobacterium radiotolerans TaxID=31998 RepID=UPI001FD99F3C|nr:hypothetical protein [Methylobacterium radiotolerans]